MVSQESYDDCERENENLRNALAWAAERLSEADRSVLERRLEDGGVTGTSREDERQELVELLVKFIKHLEPLMLEPPAPSTKQPIWFTRLDQLLTWARGYEPKHPLMRRIGGLPNVFAPAGKV